MRQVQGARGEFGAMDLRSPVPEDAPPLGRHRGAQVGDLPAEIEKLGVVPVIDRPCHGAWHHLHIPCRSCDIRGELGPVCMTGLARALTEIKASRTLASVKAATS